MALQLNFPDQFGRTNPNAYLILERGEWSKGSGGFQMTARIFADKAASEGGKAPVHEFSVFVPFDSNSMTSGIEQAIAQRPEIAACNPVQVT